MKFPRRSYLFLEIILWNKNVTNPVLVVVNLPPIVFQVVVLMSSVLMNGAEVYDSRMLLLLSPISASAMRRCSLSLIMRLTTISVVDFWVR
jgi:hypothetical protein